MKTVPAVKTQHSYINAFAHRKGRGFLGFERTIVERVIGSTTRSTTISDNEIESMGNTCLAMPSTTTMYDGNDYLLSETEYDAHSNISYENDFMWGFNAVLGRYNADHGDRWRTAAVKINTGPFYIGTNMFTGDPGTVEERDNGAKIVYDEDGNPHLYYIQHDALNPDERAGVLYIGFGSIRLGWNSEGIRHAFQNRFAHDCLTGGDAYWFLPLEIKPSFYFYYGTGTGDTLW